MGKCVIPWCDAGCKNLNEHYAMVNASRVTTPVVVTKKVPQGAENGPVTTITTPVTTQSEVTTKVTTQRKSTQKEIDKVKAWRSENREKYNEYMRVLRAKKDFSHLENIFGDGI
uniref:Uncharacterized protein n=1 Tax=viral metagenome TaxID=1070528 RepID=A0A6M3J2Z1_9ZZZZ